MTECVLESEPQRESVEFYIDGQSAGGGVFDATGNSYTGLIDEIRIYHRALSPAEAARLAGRPAPRSTQSFRGALLTTVYRSSQAQRTLSQGLCSIAFSVCPHEGGRPFLWIGDTARR